MSQSAKAVAMPAQDVTTTIKPVAKPMSWDPVTRIVARVLP